MSLINCFHLQNHQKNCVEKKKNWFHVFAYSDSYKNFVHSVRHFINDYIKENQDISEEDLKYKLDEFENVLIFVEKYFPYGFRKRF